MVIDYVLVSVALIWLIAASITDIKKREVPDWLNFSLIIIALALKSLQSIITEDFTILLNAIIALVIFLALANLMYYTRQWGGGDSKLIIGLGIIFVQYPPTFLQFFDPKLTILFPLTFFVNLLFIGAIYAIVYSLTLTIKNFDKVKKYTKVNRKNYKKSGLILPLISIFLIIISFLLKFPISNLVLSIGVSLLVLYPLLILTKVVENSLMIKKLPTKKLTEGDWIYQPIYYKKRLLISNKIPGITKNHISLLKKYRIRNVIIKEGIPFVPAFLISTIISLIFGNFWWPF